MDFICISTFLKRLKRRILYMFLSSRPYTDILVLLFARPCAILLFVPVLEAATFINHPYRRPCMHQPLIARARGAAPGATPHHATDWPRTGLLHVAKGVFSFFQLSPLMRLRFPPRMVVAVGRIRDGSAHVVCFLVSGVRRVTPKCFFSFFLC